MEAFSLFEEIDSSVMYRVPRTARSSFCSTRIPPISLVMVSSLGSEVDERAVQLKDRPPNIDDVGPALDFAVETFEWVDGTEPGVLFLQGVH